MFGFNMFETYEVTFEIYIEDKLANKQTMQAPKEILMANFIQTMQKIGEDKRPIRIKMSRPEIIWDRYENKEKVLENAVIFNNNAMVAYEENNKGETE